jgi:hypothetical protein
MYLYLFPRLQMNLYNETSMQRNETAQTVHEMIFVFFLTEIIYKYINKNLYAYCTVEAHSKKSYYHK